MQSFGDFYRGKTALVTGHTGFKGSWLAIWLTHLGARVIGYALEPPTTPSHFVAARLDDRIVHVHADLLDYETLLRTFETHRPQVVFHLGAQSLVRRSYEQPRHTFAVNMLGTANVLDAAVRCGSVASVVAVTSDKCYRNVEWEWGYRETDELGGDDPYSASKACAELAIRVYQSAKFQHALGLQQTLPVASVRAGNVIGGGDWACDRIVPDLVRAIAARTDLVLRNPAATRPWQHVLDALSGYLWLGSLLATQPELASGWNFGPTDDGHPSTVEDVVRRVLHKWPTSSTNVVIQPDASARESHLLRLDSSKARAVLGWQAAWTLDDALDAVVGWYSAFYEVPDPDMFDVSASQVDDYTRAARLRQLRWAQSD